MADVYTVLFVLIGILISLPGLLVALNLMLPTAVRRAETRLQETPGKTFLLGAPVPAVFLIVILITSQIPGIGQGIAIVTAVLWMGLGTLGAAGLTRLLAARLAPISQPYSELMNLVKGAVVYELACLFPIVGWFLFAPLMGIALVGTAVFALLGWLPRPLPREQPTPVPENR